MLSMKNTCLKWSEYFLAPLLFFLSLTCHEFAQLRMIDEKEFALGGQFVQINFDDQACLEWYDVKEEKEGLMLLMMIMMILRIQF